MITFHNTPEKYKEVESIAQFIVNNKIKLLHPVKVIFTGKPGKKHHAMYYNTTNRISIYEYHFHSIRDICHLIAHELRHAEQWQLRLPTWNKQTEQDADKYADIWVWDYFYAKDNGGLP